jgi:NADPH-dependent 2,4-dienoyl-CoA reductase/sulfur reductase-like enzyme
MRRVGQPRLVIVGASTAGLKAAARARRLLPDAPIVVIDESQSISFGACGLPYYLAGEIDDIRALSTTPFDVRRDSAYFAEFKNIEVRTGCRAESVDVRERTVSMVRPGERDTIAYDKLVLATGASPRQLECIDGDGESAGCIKTLEDAVRLRRALSNGQVQSVAIVGAGPLGCELAEALRATWDCEVCLVEAAPHVLPGMLDPEMAGVVQQHLIEQKIQTQLGCGVTRVARRGGKVEVQLGDATIAADRVLFAMGVTPRTSLAEKAGIQIGRRGGIVTDEFMRTSAPHVYAAGDCVEVSAAVHGGALLLPLASVAVRQGRVVGDNLAGRRSKFPRAAGSAVLRVFDLNVGGTGLTRTVARREGVSAGCVWGTFRDVPHYYPEGHELLLMMVYEPASRRLVGLQAVGRGDVLRPIDVFANLIQRRATLQDLVDAEFAYAPPFSSPMDPLHTLAALAQAQESDGVRSVGPGELLDGRVLVDVRERQETEEHPIAQSLCVSLRELRRRSSELPESELILICEKGQRGMEAARILIGCGRRNVSYAAGGRILREASCCTRSS